MKYKPLAALCWCLCSGQITLQYVARVTQIVIINMINFHINL